MSEWNQILAQYVEGKVGREAVVQLLRRVDLPAEARREIEEQLAMMDMLDRTLTPTEPARDEAIERLRATLRSAPMPDTLPAWADQLDDMDVQPADEEDEPYSFRLEPVDAEMDVLAAWLLEDDDETPDASDQTDESEDEDSPDKSR